MIQSVIIRLIYFDIFYTERWMPKMMKSIGMNKNDIENDEAINIQFSQNGLTSKQFLVNIGSSLVFIAGYLGMWLCFLIIMRIHSFWP